MQEEQDDLIEKLKNHETLFNLETARELTYRVTEWMSVIPAVEEKIHRLQEDMSYLYGKSVRTQVGNFKTYFELIPIGDLSPDIGNYGLAVTIIDQKMVYMVYGKFTPSITNGKTNWTPTKTRISEIINNNEQNIIKEKHF